MSIFSGLLLPGAPVVCCPVPFICDCSFICASSRFFCSLQPHDEQWRLITDGQATLGSFR